MIRRIKDVEMIGHVHTGGKSGRGELHLDQELNYKPIMQALVDIGYQVCWAGIYPHWRSTRGFVKAVHLCDV